MRMLRPKLVELFDDNGKYQQAGHLIFLILLSAEFKKVFRAPLKFYKGHYYSRWQLRRVL